MIKVALIGAGSVVFSRNMTGDILSYPEFKNAHFSYMDIDQERLEVGAALCRKIAQSLGANPTIEATQDRKKAVAGADFVINMVQIGGFGNTLVDFEIARKYGLNYTIADTTGPGGLFRALRTYPMLKGLCEDMMELCPQAVLLNYSNPMSMNMQTISRTSNLQAVGLCHSVQGTFNGLMRYLGEKPEEVAFVCAGINHMAFYLKIEKNGVDLYPRLFEASCNPEIFAQNKVRFELMKRLGYFVTESSEHHAEYNPYFIPHGKEMVERFEVPIDDYLRRCDGAVEEFKRLKKLIQDDQPLEHKRSHEYGSTIIHSLVTGTPKVVYGNMPNRGAIRNLPDTAIVEVPTLVDRAGLQFTTVGELPPQLVGYVMPHVTQHELFIRAAMEGRRDHLYQACMFDPLTAATLNLDQIVEMCDELIESHQPYLPKLDKKTLVTGSGKKFKPVQPDLLIAQYHQKHSVPQQDYLVNWHVIGPFPSDTPRLVNLDMPTAVEADLAKTAEKTVHLSAPYKVGGNTLHWQRVKADEHGVVDLSQNLGKQDWVLGYAYAEFDAVHGYDAVLRCRSDDGIRIWLNGQEVHKHECRRALRTGVDVVPIFVQEGKNRLLVKIDNYLGDWGFSVGVSKPTF